jgi:uncharacterized membrane protein YoaK (UPF0700 family)
MQRTYISPWPGRALGSASDRMLFYICALWLWLCVFVACGGALVQGVSDVRVCGIAVEACGAAGRGLAMHAADVN